MINPSKFMKDFKAFINLLTEEEKMENERFIDNGDGTITDATTYLMWTKDANLAEYSKTYQQALDYASNLTLCGYSDWRLPSDKELESLVDRSKFNPALPVGHSFINVREFYWSGTTCAYGPNLSWVINLWGGVVTYDVKSGFDFCYVWAVRTVK